MAIEAISMLYILKRPFFLGMVDATKIAKSSFFLYILHEIPLYVYNCCFFFAVMSAIHCFILFVVGWIDAAVVTVCVIGARRCHFGDILFFVLDCFGYLALEGVLVPKVGLHLSNSRSRSLIHILTYNYKPK